MTTPAEDAERYVLSLLEERAAMLRARVAVADDEDAAMWVAAFSVGGDRYALPLAALHAALPLRLVTPVPLAPSEVVGVLVFQGEIITVMSMYALLGGGAWREDPSILLVLEAGAGRRIAVDCAEIPRGLTLPMRAVEQAPVGKWGTREVTLRDGEQIALLDLERFFDARRRDDRGA